MSRGARVNQVILIIIDDIRAEHLFKFIDEGKMPNMASLVNNGVSSRNCITTFPAITFPCMPNIVTGTYSGYYPKEGSGIPTFHWVNRSDPPTQGKKYPYIRNYAAGFQGWNANDDIGPNAKTIFEQAGEGNFLSSFNVIYRGSYFYPPSKFKVAKLFIKFGMIKKNIALANWMSLDVVEKAFQNPKEFFFTNEVPKVTVGYIPGTDELMHHQGFDHPKYINEVIKCDEYLGKLIKTLKETGHYDDTAIAIITDHGNYKAENMHNLEPFFKSRGIKQYNPKKGTGDFDIAFGSVGFFNFRGDSWHEHPSHEQMRDFQPSGVGSSKLDLFEMSWKIPGVKLMYYRDEENTPDKGIIHLERKDKNTNKIIKGHIEYEGHGKLQKSKYVFEGQDLYGYDKDENAQKILDSKFHTIDEWLAATSNVDFSMLIDQIPRYFKNPRGCDIMVSTLGEYGFGFEHGKTKGTYPYSHDIALKKSITVPFILGGSSEIPNLEIPFCKTTDVVPTLLDLLGIKPHKSVVGTSLIKSS